VHSLKAFVGMASQDLQSRVQEVKLEQWFVFAALGLTSLAFFFSIGGLADVWWAGAYEVKAGRHTINVAYTSTLWEVTVDAGTKTTEKIDDMCAMSDSLDKEKAANCRKNGAVRAFVFLKFFAVVFALACSSARLFVQYRSGVDTSSSLQKHLLTAAIACKAFASFCAFVATCIAPSLDFGEAAVGAAGAGYVLTILSMILLLWPSVFLESFVWRKSYAASKTDMEVGKTSVANSNLPASTNLPTLVGSKAASKSDAESNVKEPKDGADLESNIVSEL